MDFVWKLYGNTYAVHVTVALVGVATLNLALPPPPPKHTPLSQMTFSGELGTSVKVLHNNLHSQQTSGDEVGSSKG